MPKEKKVTSIPAVIYARYSSSGQREESIVGQIRDCKRYAEAKGFNVLHEYTDEAKSGTSDARPGFQKMIKDSDKHDFKAVLVWKLDRFARNRYDSAIYKAKLKKNGVRVYSAMEAISEGSEGIIMEGLMESMAEYYSANLSENVKRGNYDSCLEHKTLGKRVYGYGTDANGCYCIDKDEAPIVKQIFNDFDSNKSVVRIVNELNKSGIASSHGKKWNQNLLRSLLRNDKYTGVYHFGSYREENVIPVIIKKDLFESVQMKIGGHHSYPSANRPDPYLLTTKLFCGECGASMTGDYGKGAHGQIYYYYACMGRKKDRKSCNKKRVSKKAVEDAIINEMINQLNDQDYLEELADRFMSYQVKEDKNDVDRNVLTDQLHKTETALTNTLKAIDSGISGETISNHVDELEERKRQLTAAIEKHNLDKPPFITRDEFLYWFEWLRSSNSDTYDCKQRLVDCFLNSAYTYNDGTVLVNTNIVKGAKTVTFSESSEDKKKARLLRE
jgi:DNA invertase Pin-like site-specific DNA recombinase